MIRRRDNRYYLLVKVERIPEPRSFLVGMVKGRGHAASAVHFLRKSRKERELVTGTTYIATPSPDRRTAQTISKMLHAMKRILPEDETAAILGGTQLARAVEEAGGVFDNPDESLKGKSIVLEVHSGELRFI